MASVMSFRIVLAGPSRLPRPRYRIPPLNPSHPSIPSRRHITIAHPDLDPSKGSTRLLVKTPSRISNMIHTFAIVRAIESKLGPIISIEVPKDNDTLLPSYIILITLLRPVKLPTPLLLEIAPPLTTQSSNFLGGPSLEDVQAVLRSTHKAQEQGTSSQQSVLRFSVEPLIRRSQENRNRRSYNNQRRSNAEVAEDEEIVMALQKFGGGFFGGFEGVWDKFKHLARKEEVGVSGYGIDDSRERADRIPSRTQRAPLEYPDIPSPSTSTPPIIRSSRSAPTPISASTTQSSSSPSDVSQNAVSDPSSSDTPDTSVAPPPANDPKQELATAQELADRRKEAGRARLRKSAIELAKREILLNRKQKELKAAEVAAAHKAAEAPKESSGSRVQWSERNLEPSQREEEQDEQNEQDEQDEREEQEEREKVAKDQGGGGLLRRFFGGRR